MIIAAKAATSSAGGFTTPQAIITTQTSTVWSTLDGITWTSNSLTTPASSLAATYIGTNWVISSNADGRIYYANDTLPASWTASTVANTTGRKRDFTISGSSYLAVGTLVSSGFNRYEAEQSTAVATWTDNTTGLNSDSFYQLHGSATNGSGTWAAVGDNSSAQLSYQTSLGGTWTTGTIGAVCYGIAFGASTWVAVGDSGSLYSSTNLTTWTSRTSQFSTSQIRQVRFGNSLFVAVGANGKISTSTDGTTWTARTSGTTETINDVRWCNPLGLWIACANAGKILTSSDAITWSTQAAPGGATSSLYRVAVKP